MNGPDDRLADSRTPGLSTLWIVLVVLVADQISKYIVTAKMTAYGPPVDILGSFFRLTFIHNRGAAFGLNPVCLMVPVQSHRGLCPGRNYIAKFPAFARKRRERNSRDRGFC